jgi:hypothetical protein
VRDDLGRVHQQRVLDEEVVTVLELRAESGLQQPRPEQALRANDWVVAVLLVEVREARAVQAVRAAAHTEARVDFFRRGLDVARRGQHALEPDEQRVHIRLRGADGQRAARLVQLVLAQVIAAPLRPVGQHPDVAAVGGRLAGAHVAAQLLDRVTQHSGAAKVLLDLDDGGADLHVDAAPLARLWLEQDVVREAQPVVEQQLTDVRLQRRFGARGVSRGDPGRQLFDRCHVLTFGRDHSARGAEVVELYPGSKPRPPSKR